MSELDKVLDDIKQREIDMEIQIVNQQAALKTMRVDLKDCVNELCHKCGSYREEHLGACDSCRWKDVRHGG